MKARHVQGYRIDARARLSLLHVTPDQDFHTLSSSQVDKLLEMADEARYQKPRNANGSRARYFYAQIQRRAK